MELAVVCCAAVEHRLTRQQGSQTALLLRDHGQTDHHADLRAAALPQSNQRLQPLLGQNLEVCAQRNLQDCTSTGSKKFTENLFTTAQLTRH
jgi:hypothetical protein